MIMWEVITNYGKSYIYTYSGNREKAVSLANKKWKTVKSVTLIGYSSAYY